MSRTEHGHFLVESHLIVHSQLGDSCFSYFSFRCGEDSGLYFYTFSYIPFHVFIFRKEQPSIVLIGYHYEHRAGIAVIMDLILA